ncbi:MAG: hypothetical protein Q8L87_14020 [Anaerolineales bacterium]|nr:hypothetical protein [Anaerolineales bacterium]
MQRLSAAVAQAAVLGGVLRGKSCAGDGAGSKSPDMVCLHTKKITLLSWAG